jgi:hypothetical protein
VGESGMIGYELFARFVTRIDYGAHRLTFIDRRHFNPATAGTPVPFTLYHQLPEVHGEYDGIPARFAIDTGARTPLVLTRSFVERNRLRSGRGVEAVVGWGVGGATRGFVERGGVLTLGNVTVTRPLTILATDKRGAMGFSDAFPNIVGSGLLKRFVITLDYGHQTLYLKPVEAAVTDLDTFDRAGMWFNETPRGFLVADVTADSPAATAGLRKDDVITAVNGRPAHEIKVYELRERLRTQAPGTSIVLTVRRGVSESRVRLTLEDLV